MPIDPSSPPIDERLARMFEQFAEHEFRGTSPVYTTLAFACAEDARLARPLLAAPARQRRALLLFAAGQYLLRTVARGHRLAEYLPVLGGDRPVDAGLVPAFADLLAQHEHEVARLCATRTTQTNEAARSALLRPAFGRTAELIGHRPLGLIELGTSAGLLLLPERYGYRFVDDAGVARRYGRPDAPAPLVFSCAVSGGWPEPVGVDATIGSRAGVDLNPVRSDDPDAVAWLRSCIWPEQVDRLGRLDAALTEVAAVRPRLVAGDLVETVPSLVSSVDAAAVPVVFTCHALTYLPGARQRQLAAVLADLGRQRDLVVVLNEGADCGIQLFAPDAPAPPPGPTLAVLTVVSWLDGRGSVEALGLTGPHGTSIAWQPRAYAHHPPA
ncbi:MAG: DUF2332 domain-containing protein [Micromonosporaceae bacterium]